MKKPYRRGNVYSLYTVCILGAGMSTVISVRVPKWLKEKLDKYGINIAEIVRKRLLEEVEKIELEEVEKQLDTLRERLKNKIDPYELARIIDEERRER